MKHIVVIGGGASGMMAAITAARTGKEIQVTILERKEKTGKKILATGNGRCNLTNLNMNIQAYRSDHIEFAEEALSQFDQKDTLQLFESFGLVTKCRDTYVYPRSDQASAVLNILNRELLRRKIKVVSECQVMDVKKKKGGFLIFTDGDTYKADAVILAAGSKASKSLGSDGSGYQIAKSFGHTLSPVVPALVQLKVKNHPITKASGVRTQAKVTAIVGKKEVYSDTGELQITAYGISGIPVFQISRYIAKGLLSTCSCRVICDFLPEYTEEEGRQLLRKLLNQHRHTSVAEILQGIFPQKLSAVFLKLADLPEHIYADQIHARDIQHLLTAMKCCDLDIKDTNGFDNAQVCAGGVNVDEVKADSMESKLADGLYFAGEILDVDGICGGYNLQWAWTSGYLAGIHAAKE